MTSTSQSTRTQWSAPSDDELIDMLRRAAAVWFKNHDLLMLEELIRRYERMKHVG